jgi:hypothetical protein
MRNAVHSLSRDLQRGYCLFPRYGGEFVEKMIERIACFEVLEQRTRGNPGSDEYRFTAHDVGIAVHDLSRCDCHPRILLHAAPGG